jgi:hypothetical protein
LLSSRAEFLARSSLFLTASLDVGSCKNEYAEMQRADGDVGRLGNETKSLMRNV